MSQFLFDAFISYRRSDGAVVARWLRRELEGFKPPKSLRDKFPSKLRIYQDTAYERGTSDFYEHSIRPALLSSRYLLVIATPDAVLRAKGEDWILREVEDFTAGPNARNVVAVRAKGEFNDPLPADLIARFPNIEIVDLRGAGRFSFLNPAKAARLANEKLKLIAPLIGLPAEDMPKLRQEEEKQQQARLGRVGGIALGVLIAVSSLSVFAILSRNQTMRALESSMFSTGRMIEAAANGDAADRIGLVMEACDLIDKLSTEAGREPDIAAPVTCNIERARAHEALKEFDAAQGKLEDAIKLATARYETEKKGDSGRQVVIAREALAELFKRREDDKSAEAEYGRLEADAKRFAGKFADNKAFPEAEGEALGQIGDLQAKQGDRTRAAQSYDGAAIAVARAVNLSLEKSETRIVEWLARLYRLAGEQRKETGDVEGAMQRFDKALEAAAKKKVEGNEAAPLDLERGWTLAHVFDAERARGKLEAAQEARANALGALNAALATRGLSETGRQRAENIKHWLDKQDTSAAAK